MEHLTVICGSGERFELRLPEPELIRSMAAALEESLQQAPETRRRAVTETLSPFFPPRCRTSLADVTAADLVKLISALKLLAGSAVPLSGAAEVLEKPFSLPAGVFSSAPAFLQVRRENFFADAPREGEYLFSFPAPPEQKVFTLSTPRKITPGAPEHPAETLHFTSASSAASAEKLFFLPDRNENTASAEKLFFLPDRNENTAAEEFSLLNLTFPEKVTEECIFSLSAPEKSSESVYFTQPLIFSGTLSVSPASSLPSSAEHAGSQHPSHIFPHFHNAELSFSLPVPREETQQTYSVSREETPRSFPAPSFPACFPENPVLPSASPSSCYSDEVIAAAFCYKWHLEYAASLPPELLERCLAAAGVRRQAPAPEPPSFSQEEFASALRRNKEVREKFK